MGAQGGLTRTDVPGVGRCNGGQCDRPSACEREGRCLYKSSAEEAREVLAAQMSKPAPCQELVTGRPTDAKARKALPICTGVLDYFPDALLAVAEVSRIGNDQHNPGQPLHWAKEKSADHADSCIRHMIDRGTRDTDGGRHSAKAAWRALAECQQEIDRERAALRAALKV